ncbi:unnamed protein product [Brassicogethes aeneus]|uniref:Uncharacterized protein n=1 Tax=Brassicogethes aeneus TaxID=1431903 RepID=A0A9P0FBW3_BRAAE|nr:unnamed protein product [Brassicogethes aeneus]
MLVIKLIVALSTLEVYLCHPYFRGTLKRSLLPGTRLRFFNRIPLNKRLDLINPLNFEAGHPRTVSKKNGIELLFARPTLLQAVFKLYASKERHKRQTNDHEKDLMQSFGGDNVNSENTENNHHYKPQESSNPRNGVYYLIDWNTFLEVDDTKGQSVHLRFQPKVGDPKRFFL